MPWPWTGTVTRSRPPGLGGCGRPCGRTATASTSTSSTARAASGSAPPTARPSTAGWPPSSRPGTPTTCSASTRTSPRTDLTSRSWAPSGPELDSGPGRSVRLQGAGWGGCIHRDRGAHRQQEGDYRLGHAAGLVAGEVDVVGAELQERLPGAEGARGAALGAVQGELAGLDGDQCRAGVDVPAGAPAGLEGDVHGGDVDRPAGGQLDAGDTDVAGIGDGAAGQQLGGDARGWGGRGRLAWQGEQGGDQRRGEDGDRGGEAQRPVGQLVQGSSSRWARTSPEEYCERWHRSDRPGNEPRRLRVAARRAGLGSRAGERTQADPRAEGAAQVAAPGHAHRPLA